MTSLTQYHSAVRPAWAWLQRIRAVWHERESRSLLDLRKTAEWNHMMTGRELQKIDAAIRENEAKAREARLRSRA